MYIQRSPLNSKFNPLKMDFHLSDSLLRASILKFELGLLFNNRKIIASIQKYTYLNKYRT